MIQCNFTGKNLGWIFVVFVVVDVDGVVEVVVNVVVDGYVGDVDIVDGVVGDVVFGGAVGDVDVVVDGDVVVGCIVVDDGNVDGAVGDVDVIVEGDVLVVGDINIVNGVVDGVKIVVDVCDAVGDVNVVVV